MTAYPITTVFIDIGGVLLTNGWGHQSRQLAAKKYKLDFTEMETRHQLIFSTYELGKLDLKNYLNSAFLLAGTWHYGLNLGPIVLMIENYRSGFLWKLMQNCPYIINSLKRAGFMGGWLSENKVDR